MAETEATAEAETSAAAAPSEPSIRLWRTAFLTLRDEALTSPPPPTVIQLLNRLIFSQSDVLLAAAPDLPSHEVTSDVMFLMDLARNTISDSRRGQGGFTTNDFVHCFTQFAHFIHAVSTRIPLKMSSTSWGHMLDSFREVVKMLCGKGEMKPLSIGDVSRARAIKQCLETIRYLFGVYQRSSMLSENKQLLEFLLSVLACSQDESIYSYSTCKQRMSVNNSLWDIQALAFTMIGDIYSRVGSSLPVDIWHSTIEVLRKVMDGLASKCMLVEDSVMARFYTSVLQCLHLVLVDPKGSLSGHVASLVAALRMFFQYGLINRSHVVFPFGDCKKEIGSFRTDTNRLDSKKSKSGPYRPPHLRKKDSKDLRPCNEDSLSSSENESSTVLHISSDSDYSDSDGSLRDACNVHYAKTRLAAIVCLQDLCRADPKSFTAYWTMLLPSSDVLQPRKYDTTLMSCLLFDPYIKARIASASTITAMLDGPASIFLQVAEYKESTKCGSFTALSSSLGQILVQLHSGILYLIKHETNGGLLASLFKILMLLTSSTPYSRMPAELLPTAVASVKARIEEGFPSRSDNTSLMAAAINCLTIALSASPSSVHVKNMLSVEVSKGISGSLETQLKSGVLPTLIQFSEPVTNPSISLEALKALKAVAHNYPSTMVSCWEQVSSVIYGFLSFPSEPQTISWRANAGNAVGAMGERVTTAAVKVLDESLRAISGFKGTEDLSDEKLLDDPFTSDCVKTKSISSAPYYGSERPSQTVDELKASPSGSEQWSEAITKHIPLGLQHSSGVVRAASVTCFAGITSSVFFSLPKEEQNVILNSSIKAALRDEVPSVRSAACRALGIIACFPLIFQSVKILDQFITAIGHNTCDSQISVRIVASWALANICDSLRHCITADTFKKDKASSQLISLLIDSALRLAEDNDKIKANAVRALGNLSRFVPYTSESLLNDEERDCTGSPLASSGANNMSTSGMHRDNSSSFQQASVKDSLCLEKMVQVFLSCVTTGNVKVQWNVCHALSNLFCNKTLKLQDASWAPSVFSILLLLLRDSSNFKIRIQAAAALAVPATVNDYRRSFYDVLKGVEHIIENSGSDLVLSPSNFKYKVALEKQLTSTLLHVLGLASRTNSQAVQDFLVKKASFLEEWLKELRLSLEDRTAQVEAEDDMLLNQKKDVISRAIHSLVEVYEGSNHHAIAQKFDKLAESIL